MADKQSASSGLKVGFKEQLGYMGGGVGMQIANKTVSQYLLVFFTNCLLLNPAAAGAVFMWGRIVDAFTDIFMANISDKTQTRWGSYRPYMIFGTIPLALTFIFCFFCPSFVQENGKTLVWAYVMYFLEASVFNTMCGMNYGALSSANTDSPQGRSKLASARNIGENIATLIIGAGCMSIVVKYGGPGSPVGWLRMALLFAGIIVIGYFLCIALVKERVEIVPKAEKKLPLKTRLRTLKGNKPFLGIVLSIAFLMFVAVFGGTFFAYYCMYNLGHAEWIAPLVTVSGVVGIVGALLLVPLTKRIEKRQVLALGSAMWLVGSLLLVAIGGFTGAIIYQAITGFGQALAMSSIWAAIPDMCDYGAWKNNVSSPGIVYSICMFVLKVVSGFATYGCGAILALTGFDAALGLNQLSSVVSGISFSIAVVPAICSVIVILCSLLMKDVDRDKMAKYHAAKDN